MAGWMVILDTSGCFPHLSEELKLFQLPAAQVTLAVELNQRLGYKGAFAHQLNTLLTS